MSVSGTSKGGDGDGSTEFDEEGLPMYLSPIFYSTMVMDIPLGRYRATEYYATFDDNRPI